MGFIKDMSDTLNEASWVLNEAAFGDIRNVLNGDAMYEFRTRPIGLVQKSYGFMLHHLQRNIGNTEFKFDGYGNSIGELSNPYYNTLNIVPWFYNDDYKNSTSNYIEYIRNAYGATISVENINNGEVNTFRLSDDASSVGSVDGKFAIEALVSNADLLPNNNNAPDTRLGRISGFYNRETLSNAININDERYRYKSGKKNDKNITSTLSDYLGLTTNNVTIKKTYLKEIYESTGRFEDGIKDREKDNIFSPLHFTDGPVYTSNYGHYSDIGSYIGYYDSLGEKVKGYYEENVYKDRTFYPVIRNNGGKVVKGEVIRDVKKDRNGNITGGTGNWIKGGTYLSSLNIRTGHEDLKRKIYISNPEDGFESTAIDNLQIRYIFSTMDEHSNISDAFNGGVYVYTENENGSSTNVTFASYNSGTRFSRYTSYNSGLAANDLLKKTNESFKNGNYKTIIARFHTDYDESEATDTTQTAISKEWGMSHGRNLLKLTPDDSEGYTNPYCRVWTFHHQYHRLADAIRPLNFSASELYSKYGFSAFTANHGHYGNGRERLEQYGTLNKHNGLVNITPIDSSDVNRKVDIKNCMFSIENLAWKGMFSTDALSRESYQTGGLSSEQKGPFGGRIMWFPPYDLKFQEDVNVNWNETNFIGRGEGIYTYANTTRTGTLSFKILVDHPSIIDYWEDRGKSRSDSVDEKDDPEQQLLRFFAGCDMLTSKPMPLLEPEAAISDEAISSPDSQEIKFFVFFPNYYSGKDDKPEWAMKYLTNGLGAGKEKAWHMKANGDCYRDDEITDYEIPYANAQNRFGGYEMRPGMPISIVREQDKGNITGRGGFIEDVKIGDYGNGTRCNEHKTSLFVQMGDDTSQWWQRKWYYRVDNTYVNRLLLKENYVDSKSFCLNSKAGLGKVAEHFSVKNDNTLFSLADVYVAFDKNSSIENGASYVLNGLYDEEKVKNFRSWITQYGIKKITCAGRASAPGKNEDNYVLQMNRAKTVKNWLCAFGGIDSSLVEATRGGAGGEGAGINNGDDNSIVNKLWRCVEVTIELQKSVSKTVQEAVTEVSMPNNTNPSSEEASEKKEYRQVNVLGTTDGIINTLSKTGNRKTFDFVDLNANMYVQQHSLKDRIDSIRLHNLGDNINGLALNYRDAVRSGNLNLNSIFNMAADFTDHDKHFQYNSIGEIINRGNNYGGKSDYNYVNYSMHDIASQNEVAGGNNTVEDKANIVGAESESINSTRTREGTNNNEPKRYDNEATFFSMLEKEEPFLHHKISDKVKYFDPAFHSINPEGFNARLTFLQQCTRQGPTIGNSDNHTADNTANNLAFGRPPVCILRIGDFYYTKIIIDGLTINFDPLMWDLNSEGIGVMPMIADVNLRFKFIGGSSLAGHITRLQNALSFNYYANTEVYDNRAEIAEYDENGNLQNFKPNPIT